MAKKTGMWIMAIALTLVLVGGIYMVTTRQTSTGDGGGADNGANDGCDGIASIKALYNDFNYYKAGTDPASTLTVYEMDGQEFKKTVSDDATTTTLDASSNFKAVAGTNAGTPSSGYFSELIDFSTGCTDKDLQPKLKPSGAPTITIVNDDGITANSDTNHESMGASSTYLPTLVIKAPAEACSARYGAFIVADYDATYYSKVTSSDLSDGNTIVLLAHNIPTTNITGGGNYGTNDQFKVFEYNGELCNGAKIEPQMKIETTSTQPTEDINVDFYWMAKDIDTDADSYRPLAPAYYDEDNNVIGDINVNKTFFGA